jgi:hypothetical protein
MRKSTHSAGKLEDKCNVTTRVIILFYTEMLWTKNQKGKKA